MPSDPAKSTERTPLQFEPPSPRPSPAEAAPDAALEFASESRRRSLAKISSLRLNRRLSIVTAVGFLLPAAAAGAYWANRESPAVSTGFIRIESEPSGAEVRFDGTPRGTTPLALTLPTGEHVLTVQHGGSSRDVTVAVTAERETVHHITWTPSEAAPTARLTGSLHVATDAPGGIVLVDGAERGRAPLTVRDLPSGQHEVVVRSGGTSHRRTIQIAPGSTASLVISGATPAIASGWMSVPGRVPMQVFENQQLIGTTAVDRIMLPAGDHDFEFVAESLGFRATRRVRIAAGQTASVQLELPRAALNINALPWAEVFIDGAAIGETPLGNVMQTIGPHVIVFRHPQFGERRVTAVVTMNDTTRVSVDMRNR